MEIFTHCFLIQKSFWGGGGVGSIYERPVGGGSAGLALPHHGIEGVDKHAAEFLHVPFW